MKTIMLELSEEQFSRLMQAAELSCETIPELVKDRLIDLLEEPIDPFEPRSRRERERDEAFRRRIA